MKSPKNFTRKEVGSLSDRFEAETKLYKEKKEVPPFTECDDRPEFNPEVSKVG
jgi:hypothetical protein